MSAAAICVSVSIRLKDADCDSPGCFVGDSEVKRKIGVLKGPATLPVSKREEGRWEGDGDREVTSCDTAKHK